MADVERLLSKNLLADGEAGGFHKSRARVSQRHGHWRANFPAIGLLLDGDEERAQALAGNYATESREIVGVWLSALESAPAAIEERAAWIEAYWAAWRETVLERDDVAVLEGAPRDRFVAIFDELMVRFRDDAVAFVRSGAATGMPAPSLMARFTSPLRRFGCAIESFFFPSVRR